MIEKIQHYSMTNQASIFDEEALTALELAGRTAAKVNECVEVVNDTVEGLPGMVANDVQEHIDNGDFTEQINTFTGDLRAQVKETETNLTNEINATEQSLGTRLDNLLGSVTAGTTSMDAEVIDGRVSANNETYTNLGDSVRAQNSIKMGGIFDYAELTPEIFEDSVYESWGSRVVTGFETYVCAKYTFNGEKIIRISGASGAAAYPGFIVYRADGTTIYKHHIADNAAVREYIYAVPSDAAYIYINGKRPINDIRLEKCTPIHGEDGVRSVFGLDACQLHNYRKIGGYTEQALALTEENTRLIENKVMDQWGSWGTIDGYDTLIFPIPQSWERVIFREYNIGVVGGTFVDADRNRLASIETNYPHHLEETEIPAGTKYIYLTVKNSDRYKNVYGVIPVYTLDGLSNANPWAGKKVVWIGTSVPYGSGATKSYAMEAAKALGFEIVGAVIPGINIHLDDGGMRGIGSIAMSLDEYTAEGVTIPATPVAWVPGSSSYNHFYASYENIFSEANKDADLYVFDVAPNNGNFTTTDWDAFDHENFVYKDGSDFADHRDTFLGAMLFLMRKMYDNNPNARMCLFLGSQFNYDKGKNAFTLLVEQYNIPFIDVWAKINTTPPSIAKIHPSATDMHPTTFGHELMGRMVTGILPTIA